MPGSNYSDTVFLFDDGSHMPVLLGIPAQTDCLMDVGDT